MDDIDIGRETDHIINDYQSNSTIDKAIQLIDHPCTMQNGIKAKAVGLQLTLLGVAEVQALRIKNLVIAAYKLECQLYDPKKMQDLEPRKLLATYEALNTVLSDAINYIKGMSKFDWKELQDNLTTLVIELDAETEGNRVSTGTQEVSDLASSLLAGLSGKSLKSDEKLL